MITIVLNKLIACIKQQNECICNGEEISREVKTERKVLKRLLEAYGFIVDIQADGPIAQQVTVIVDKDVDKHKDSFEAAGFTNTDKNQFKYELT